MNEAQTTRAVLALDDGWSLIRDAAHTPPDGYVISPNRGARIRVDASVLDAIWAAGYLDLIDIRGTTEHYVLTEKGRGAAKMWRLRANEFEGTEP